MAEGFGPIFKIGSLIHFSCRRYDGMMTLLQNKDSCASKFQHLGSHQNVSYGIGNNK